MHVSPPLFPRLNLLLALLLVGVANLHSQENEKKSGPASEDLPTVSVTPPAPTYPEMWKSVETVYGHTYHYVDVISADPRGVTFRHSKGIAKLPFEHFAGKFRDQFMAQEAQWDMAQLAIERSEYAVKETNFPQYQAAPAMPIIVIQVQNNAPCPPAPCGQYGPAPFTTYPATANLPCSLRTWRHRSLDQLLWRTQALKLRPFGANGRFIH